MAKKDKIEVVGKIVNVCGGGRFCVMLDNGAEVVAYPSGRVRMNKIFLLAGDKVRVEMSPYDITKGRISRRL